MKDRATLVLEEFCRAIGVRMSERVERAIQEAHQALVDEGAEIWFLVGQSAMRRKIILDLARSVAIRNAADRVKAVKAIAATRAIRLGGNLDKWRQLDPDPWRDS